MAALLAGLDVRIFTLADFPGITPAAPVEGETSYADNALGKARAAVGRATGFLSLADDSGIEVDALGGSPGRALRPLRRRGTRRRRPQCRDAARPRRRAARAAHRPLSRPDRAGRARPACGGDRGRGRGGPPTAPRGAGGFGYDPLFFYPPLDATFAEVPVEAKHAVSHRALAMARARLILTEWLRRA